MCELSTKTDIEVFEHYNKGKEFRVYQRVSRWGNRLTVDYFTSPAKPELFEFSQKYANMQIRTMKGSGHKRNIPNVGDVFVVGKNFAVFTEIRKAGNPRDMFFYKAVVVGYTDGTTVKTYDTHETLWVDDGSKRLS